MKYFILMNKCKTCGKKLIIPSWTYCEDEDCLKLTKEEIIIKKRKAYFKKLKLKLDALEQKANKMIC